MPSRLRSSMLYRCITAIACVSVAGSTACKSSTDEDEEEPEVATMRILVGSQTVNVNAETGVVTGGPITLTAGSTTFSVQFLLANGQPEPLVTATTFRMDVTSASTARVTVAKTGPFAGVLTRITAGQTTLNFSLFHLAEGHSEFDWDVPVTVQ